MGWKLALVATGSALETLLDSYEAERRPIAQAIASSGDDAEARAARQEAAATQALIQFLADRPAGPMARRDGRGGDRFSATIRVRSWMISCPTRARREVAMRETNLFRKEDGAWKMVVCHSDRLPFLGAR
jgi:FAD binding domain